MHGLAAVWPDAAFDAPPRFARVERRLAGNAVDAWIEGGGGPVKGFEANSLVIADAGGAAVLERAGEAVGAAFGLAEGMALERRGGLAAEALAACHLIALNPEPVPFEASVATAAGRPVVARGVALPVDPFGNRVQIVVSWREILDRAATARLRRELGAALRSVRFSTAADPFSVTNP